MKPSQTSSGGAKRQARYFCPLRFEVDHVSSRSQELVTALRRVKRRLKTCQRACPLMVIKPAGPGQRAIRQPVEPAASACPRLDDYNHQVRTAVAAVVAANALNEWETTD